MATSQQQYEAQKNTQSVNSAPPEYPAKIPTANTGNPVNDEGFIDFNNYKKNYVILTSDRLILNSKEDSVFIASKKSISLSVVEQIHFDVGPTSGADPKKNYFVVNSPLIQLGLPSNYRDNSLNQPVAKALSTIEFFNNIIKAIDNFCNSLIPSKGLGVGVVSLPEISVAANNLKKELLEAKKNYGNLNTSPIRSKITNTI
jgi:hypothetical protein